jgi:gamma-glutamyltranspeptidase/glutathione hydrolase
MIVAPQPEAVEAGAEILKAGGNAVDAAIGCAFVQGVVDPLMTGIAGFGSMPIFSPAHDFHGYVDFHGPAPAAARPDMWADLIEGEKLREALQPGKKMGMYTLTLGCLDANFDQLRSYV